MVLLESIEKNLASNRKMPIWRFPEEKKELPLSELYRQAIKYTRTFAALGVRSGDRVGFMLNNCSDYVAFMLAIWKIGAVAVPLRPQAGLQFDIHAYLSKIELNCRFALIIFNDDASDDLMTAWTALSGKQGRRRAEFVAKELRSAQFHAFDPKPEDMAVIQYSSGSTGEPKGVIVTHGILMEQVRQIDTEYRIGCNEAGIASSGSWLPFNHDMGLFIGILYPLFSWCDNILASPRYYMFKPKRWFTLQAEYRVELNFTTNLAMANSIRSLSQLDPGTLDLSRFYLYLAAEKVSPVILKKLYDILKVFHMPEDHFKVGYGMSENALGITSTKRGSIKTACIRVGEDSSVCTANREEVDALDVVSVGGPHIGTTITVRDDAGRVLPEMMLGEICIAGPCVTPGYYRNREATDAAFVNGMFKTRDLGFFLNEELYFYSRKDDMLVIGGRNISPEDIEDCAEELEHIASGGTVLIDTENATSGKNALALLVEVDHGHGTMDLVDRQRMIQAEIFRKKGVLIHKVDFCGKNSIEKTTSGKKRRKAIRERYLKGELKIHAAPAPLNTT